MTLFSTYSQSAADMSLLMRQQAPMKNVTIGDVLELQHDNYTLKRKVVEQYDDIANLKKELQTSAQNNIELQNQNNDLQQQIKNLKSDILNNENQAREIKDQNQKYQLEAKTLIQNEAALILELKQVQLQLENLKKNKEKQNVLLKSYLDQKKVIKLLQSQIKSIQKDVNETRTSMRAFSPDNNNRATTPFGLRSLTAIDEISCSENQPNFEETIKNTVAASQVIKEENEALKKKYDELQKGKTEQAQQMEQKFAHFIENLSPDLKSKYQPSSDLLQNMFNMLSILCDQYINQQTTFKSKQAKFELFDEQTEKLEAVNQQLNVVNTKLQVQADKADERFRQIEVLFENEKETFGKKMQQMQRENLHLRQFIEENIAK
ncbi:Hypothetical_protein [Hexamita inflata]|uniref:Hypothetical_protein n=1 Tax=Hexamita inflata TaxID=28002 RepID=A0AA86Q0M7_9EUKA|nr:Hypothetical protein HINF_LOCUS32350 [Hexamita inflata]